MCLKQQYVGFSYAFKPTVGLDVFIVMALQCITNIICAFNVSLKHSARAQCSTNSSL